MVPCKELLTDVTARGLVKEGVEHVVALVVLGGVKLSLECEVRIM